MAEIIDEIYKSLGKFIVPQTLEQTYKALIDEGCRLSGAIGGTIYLRNDGTFIMAYSSFRVRKFFQPRKEGYVYQAYTTKKIIITKRADVLKAHPDLVKSSLTYLAFIPLSYGKRAIGVLVLEFLDENTLSEEQIKILHLFGALSSLVVRKMQDFEKTKEALEGRDLFISLASHELKTPLTAIQICTNLLNKTHDANENILKNLTESTNRITNLVNDFLHLDQIRNNQIKYEFKKEGLVGIVTNLVETHKLVNPNTPITLNNKIIGNDLIRTDSYKLSQAFNNLINNAIKFSPKSSSIDITLDKNANNFSICFKDMGIGISKEDQEQLFDKFYKGSSRKKGMGLGLYLTKEIIEKHKGKIKLDSVPNRGTVVTVSLPEQE